MNSLASNFPLKLKHKYRNCKTCGGLFKASIGHQDTLTCDNCVSRSLVARTHYKYNVLNERKSNGRFEEAAPTADEIYKMLMSDSSKYSLPVNNYKFNSNSVTCDSSVEQFIRNSIKSCMKQDTFEPILSSKVILIDFCENFFKSDMPELEYYAKRGKELVRMGVCVHEGYDATPRDLLEGVIPCVKQHLSGIKALFSTLPGFKDIKTSDYAGLIKSKLACHYAARYAPLMMNGEYYFWLGNGIQYIRPHLRLILGVRLADELCSFYESFNKLDLTRREFSLLIPLILTIRDDDTPRDVDFKKIHDLYDDAFKYETKKNGRGAKFWKDLNELLSRLPLIHQLDKELKIGQEAKRKS